MEILYKIMIGYGCVFAIVASLFILSILGSISHWIANKSNGKI